MEDKPRFLSEAEAIQVSQERRKQIGETLAKGPHPIGNIPRETHTIAPDVSGTGMSPFDAAARQGTLPTKDVSAEDKWKADQRARNARK